MLPDKIIYFPSILWCGIVCFFIQCEIVHAAQLYFSDDTLSIEDYSIKSSDIKLILADRNVSKVYVYLADTFYVDENLNLNGIKELQIFASTWNILRPVTFDLSGFDGAKQEPAINGAAGRNGNAAFDGGNFFGLANTTINGDYLTVMSNGGNGGKGQDGSSSDDVYVLLNVDGDSGDLSGDSGWFSNGDFQNYYKNYFDDRGYDTEISNVDDYTSLYAVFVHDKKASFNVRLHPRKCCGTTGMGGVGGYGGRRGNLIFKHLGMSSELTPKLFADDGSVGKSGADAKACESLALDVKIDTELKKVVFIFLPLHHSFTSTFTVLNHTDSSKCTPKIVRNNEVIDSSESSERLVIETEYSVLRYKKFLLQNMKNESLSSLVQRTYEAIDKNRQLNEEFTLKGLVSEAYELEKNYFDLKNSINVTTLYQSLIGRMKTLKRVPDDHNAMLHLEKMFNYKLNDIKIKYSLIYDIEAFIEVINMSIDLRNRMIRAISNVNDVELQNSLNQLRFGVNGNFIITEFYHVIKWFRIAYFPFAVDYLENYSMPKSLSSYNDLEDITIFATSRLNVLIQSMWEIKSNNGDIMMNINYIDYTSPDDAIFIWKHSDFRDKIVDLFAGKKVTLLSDVKESQYNAMKYNTVDIAFRSSDQTVNDRLNNLLQAFDLKLVNTGVSATRCDNQFYQITTDPYPIVTSFSRNANGIPMSRLMTYDKLRDSPPTLSPYTVWDVQILEINEWYANHRNISELAAFGRYDFDIELHGTGKYIQDNVPICNSRKLGRFYSQILN